MTALEAASENTLFTFRFTADSFLGLVIVSILNTVIRLAVIVAFIVTCRIGWNIDISRFVQ